MARLREQINFPPFNKLYYLQDAAPECLMRIPIFRLEPFQQVYDLHFYFAAKIDQINENRSNVTVSYERA